MANDNNEIQEQQGIQFEDIQPWVEGSGDTGLSARLKLKRNFDKIKAIIDAISNLPSLIRNYLSRVNDDTAEGEITFKKGLKVGTFRSRFLGSGAAVDPAGNAEFESIYSRSFISTPEFRFNRITVTEGELWCTNGYGIIEDVKEGEDENGNAVVNGGLITLHLDENDFASVQVGDICRGIYNDIAEAYETATVDDDVQIAAGSSAQEGDGIGFSAKKGFFTSYFYIERMVKNRKGECQFIYKLRSATTPHPCVFMKFAQYGSFTNAERRASKYESSINHYYEMILEGINTWQIQSANIVYRKGYLGDMEVELADHTTRQLQGYGLYAQNNVYFGSAVIQLDPYTLEMLERDLAQYDVNLGEHVDMIVVDDTGNVIGGVYTETTEGGVTTREYRIHSAITVRKKNVLLTEALAGAEAGTGTYKISFTPVGCTAIIENSTLYITGVDHVKDGVAGSGDDANFDYDAMRAVDSCRVDLVIDCEGVTSVQKSIPIVIKHDSQPYVGADITNEISAVSWNTKTQQYAGLPIVFDFKMWHNDEVLDIVSANDVSVTLADGTAIPNTWTYTKTIVENANGNKVARISISGLPANLGLVTDLNITCAAVYSGVRYERTLVHTINKSTDTNVYSLISSVDEVIVNKNTGGLSSNSVDISVACDSSDNKHYAVAYNQFGIHQLCICYKKFYTDGTSDANETEYTGDAVSVNSGVERVSFFLYKKVGNAIDRTVLHDKEDVPVIANGQDGKGVEYIFLAVDDWDEVEAHKPTIYDDPNERQRDDYCPYTDQQHTDQWTDEPTGVGDNMRVEFYAQRKQINGIWQPFGDVKLWNRYVVDGVTPYIIDLSNEQSMVACDENGNVIGNYESSRLMIFLGQSYAFENFAITITPTNIHCNGNSSAFNLTAEQKAAAQTAGYFELVPSNFNITASSATISIQATYGNITLSAVYKVNKSYAGKNGVIYSLMPSLDTIRRDKSGNLVDTTLTLQVKKTVGATATILTTYSQLQNDGLSLQYQNAGGTYTLSDVSIATSTLIGSGLWGKINLLKSSTIVDSERLNVVIDGNDGAQGKYEEIEYAVGDNRSTAPSSGWSSSQPSPTPSNPYVWRRSRVYNPATGSYSGYTYVCLTGYTGATGPMYYPAGIHDSTKAYSVTSQLVPVVCSSGNNPQYYYAKESVPAGEPITNTRYWEAFSKFAAAFIEVLFANFAKLGSFIIYDNLFFSQLGTINGSVSTDYTNSNFQPYLKMDAENGYIYARRGTIGGFNIGDETLGTSYDSGTVGGTYIRKDGYMRIYNVNNYTGLSVIGGAELIGATNKPVTLINNSGSVSANGNTLNLNTIANNNNQVNIGNATNTQSVNINARGANFGGNTPVSIGSSLEVQGKFILNGDTTFITNNSSTAKTVALPSNASRGQVVFAKGTVGNLTLTGAIRNDEGDTVTSIGGDRRSRIFIYGDSYWNEFYCS